MAYLHYIRKTVLFCIVLVTLAACEEPADKFVSHLNKGDDFYAEQDYIRARLEYRNAAKINPTDARAIYSLGLVEEAEGNLQLALSAFLTSERQDPAFMPVLIKLAEFYLKAQMPDESRARVNAILAIDPDNAQAYAISGSVFLSQRDFQKAQSDAERSLSIDSNNVVAYSVLAGIQFAQDNFAEAQAILDEAITVHPKELSFYLLKASGYTEANDVDGLVAVYHDIFDLAPNAIGYRLDLADVLVQAGRRDEAAALYRQTVEQFADNLGVKYRYITFTERQQGVQAADNAINDFIERNPDMKIFSLWRANMYLRNDKYDDAIQILEKTLIRSPDSWIALNASTALADIKLQTGDLQMARDLIDEVLEQDVNNQEALLLRANMAFEQGSFEQAVIDLRGILRDNPDNLKAARILAEAFMLQNRVDLAVDTLIQAGQRHPDDAGTLVRLAQLYALRGNVTKAEEILTLVTDQFPENPLGWEVMARLSLQGNRFDRAALAIQKLANSSEDGLTANYLRAQLLHKQGETPQALAIYKDIIANHSTSPLAAFALSSVMQTAQNQDDFIDLREFLVSLNSQDAVVLTVIGTIDMAIGNKEGAELSFRQAIQANPQSQAPFTALAELLRQQGDDEQALVILQRAEDAIPTEADASMNRAAMLLSQKRIQEAADIYDAILERDETNDIAANNLAHVIADYQYMDPIALDRARVIAERFINSDNPFFLDTLGWVYYRQGEYAQAQAILKRAVDTLEESKAEIDYHYGAALMALGQNDEAEEFLKRAVESEDDFVGKDAAVELLHLTTLPF